MSGTFTYDVDALDTELYRIRLALGDTDSDDPLLYDEEITQIQSEESAYSTRVAKCCRSICAKLARDTRVKFGEFSEDGASIYQHYIALAERYESAFQASYIWSSSITVSDKETYTENTDLVQPKFKKGMQDVT